MARQRFGQGIKSCNNLNKWRHFFTPNSASAQAGALDCFDHWSNIAPPSTGGNSPTVFDTKGDLMVSETQPRKTARKAPRVVRRKILGFI